MAKEFPIESSIWRQTAMRGALVYLKNGNLVDVHRTRFEPRFEGDTPQVELLRSHQPFGLVNIRDLPLDDIQYIHQKNSEDLEVFYKEASSEARSGRMTLGRTAAVTAVAGISLTQSVLQYKAHQNINNCMTPSGRAMTLTECVSPQAEEAKIQTQNEAIAFGVIAALFAGAAIVTFRSAAKCFKSSKEEFTKAALAVSNIKYCEMYLNVPEEDRVEARQPDELRHITPIAPPMLI